MITLHSKGFSRVFSNTTAQKHQFFSAQPSLRRRQRHPTPVLLPGKSHGRRSLVGCSPWGCEESDTTKRLHFHFSLCCIGGGNGNPLHCSCLENPRDGGAWWAAVYGVAKSQTRLKRLSSSSSSRAVWLPSGKAGCVIINLSFSLPIFKVSFSHFMWFRSIQMNSIYDNRYSSNASILTALASGSSFSLPSVSDSTSLAVGSSLAFWHCRMPSCCFFR